MYRDFNDINEKIQSFLEKEEKKAYTLADKKYRLPLSDAIFCARDTVRNKAFYKAISLAIPSPCPTPASVIPAEAGIYAPQKYHKIFQQDQDRKTAALLEKVDPRLRGDDSCTVIDAGSGTGILGAFALSLGAGKCYFLEHNPYTLALSKRLIKYLGYEKKSHFIKCDAREYIPPEKYNLLISETITSGFVEEDFPQIINHLKKFGKKSSIIIPEAFELFYKPIDLSSNSFHYPRTPLYHSQVSLCHPREGGDPPHFKKAFKQSITHINLYSKKGIDIKKIQSKLKKDIKYECSMNVQLYKDIFLRSGECMSFANKRCRIF